MTRKTRVPVMRHKMARWQYGPYAHSLALSIATLTSSSSDMDNAPDDVLVSLITRLEDAYEYAKKAVNLRQEVK